MTEADLEVRIAALEAEARALAEARLVGRQALAAEIVDEAGTTRAMLATGHGGTVSLNLLDGRGVLRAALGLSAEGPTLSLFDGDGRRRIDLHVGGDDAPRLHLVDEAGTRRLELQVDPAGTASLGVLGADAAPKALLLVMAAGRGVVGASRQEGVQ